MNTQQRFSQACENNKGPIAEQLVKYFKRCRAVLEIGSGTGQHAAHFSALLPDVIWQPTDVVENHPSILGWCKQNPLDNVRPPVPFFIGRNKWPSGQYDGVFSANTAHIMQPNEVALMMSMIAQNLPVEGVFCQYGPFKINGQFTSESNQYFDHSLVSQGYGGIRDIEELKKSAGSLRLTEQIAMPANNLLLVWHQG